jgi:DNA-binding LytR/AlgR family response regulator
MKTLIIDDETAARERLRRLLHIHSEIEVIGEAINGLNAIQKINSMHPELVFLDIQMPGVDGFQVLRELDIEHLPLVVFATGFEEHAMRAFRENALAYLLKPIDPEQLRIAVDRAVRLQGSEGEILEQRRRAKSVAASAGTGSSIIGRKRNHCFLLKPDDILWFSIENGTIRARTLSDFYWINQPFGALEESLAETRFFRARRDVLVNLDHVRVIRPSERSTFALSMGDPEKTEFIVSERQSKLLRERLPGL